MPAALAAFAGPTDLDLRLRDSHANLAYRATEDVFLTAGYRLQDKVGTRKLGVAFGSPGGNFAEVARPVDEKTHEVSAGAELSLGGWSVDLDYTGSFFENEFRSVTVDNPLQGADILGASSRARLADAPDNSMHQGSLSVARPLAFDYPARVAATFSYGMRRQDDRFLPHTINSAIPSPALPQSDLDGKVQTLLANLLFTARPLPGLNVKARYRIYDYNNDTGSITFTGRVSNDRTVTAGTFTSTPNEYRTQNASVEAAYRFGPRTSLTLGYEWENWHRNRVREVTHLNDHTVALKLSAAPESWMRLQGTTAFTWRERNGYDTLEGEPAALRRWDQAKRHRYEADLRATVVPRGSWSASLTAGYRYDDYDSTEWGLTDSRRWSVGTDASYELSENVAFSGYYTYEDIDERLKSVFASPWRNHNRNNAHNAGLAMNLALIPGRLDAEVSWDYQWGRASTDSKGATGLAVDFPSIKDNLQIFATTFTYTVSEALRVNWGYHYERFHGNDFQVDDIALNATRNDIYLSDGVQDYKAHIFRGSVVLSF
jgi:MtrB/PioB family decaheme-associated outer membrane protein